MKKLLLFLMLLPVLLPAQTPVASDKPLNIFTLGDSNGTFPQSWPKQLELALPQAQVFNLSKSGRTIGFVNNGDSTLNALLVLDENLRKAAEFTKGRPFDFVVLELGTNDAKAVFADRQREVPANLATLIHRLKTCPYPAISRAKVILISPPPYGTKAEALPKYQGGNERVRHMASTFRKVARRTHCRFVNGYQTPGLDINTMTPDGLHLDATGSRLLIAPVLAIMAR
jgi:acyl-CoA thioesterase-1